MDGSHSRDKADQYSARRDQEAGHRRTTEEGAARGGTRRPRSAEAEGDDQGASTRQTGRSGPTATTSSRGTGGHQGGGARLQGSGLRHQPAAAPR